MSPESERTASTGHSPFFRCAHCPTARRSRVCSALRTSENFPVWAEKSALSVLQNQEYLDWRAHASELPCPSEKKSAGAERHAHAGCLGRLFCSIGPFRRPKDFLLEDAFRVGRERLAGAERGGPRIDRLNRDNGSGLLTNPASAVGRGPTTETVSMGSSLSLAADFPSRPPAFWCHSERGRTLPFSFLPSNSICPHRAICPNAPFR